MDVVNPEVKFKLVTGALGHPVIVEYKTGLFADPDATLVVKGCVVETVGGAPGHELHVK